MHVRFFSLFIIFLVSCASNPENNKSNKYLSAKDKESVEKILGQNISKSVDLYPIPTTDVEGPKKVYELPLPKQYFSSEENNVLRLHKLGEIRWIYLSLEPSKAWPMLLEYLNENSDLNISNANPETGEIFTKEIDRNNLKNRFVSLCNPSNQKEFDYYLKFARIYCNKTILKCKNMIYCLIHRIPYKRIEIYLPTIAL